MATWDDVAAIASALPDTHDEGKPGRPMWVSRKEKVAWSRQLRKKDRAELGDAAPDDGDVLAVWVDDEGVKEALVSADPDVFFTVTHFDGWPIVLVRLDAIPVDELDEIIRDSWLARAPKRLAQAYLDGLGSAP